MELTFIALFREEGHLVEREVGVESSKIIYHTRTNDEGVTCLKLYGDHDSVLYVVKTFEEVTEIKNNAAKLEWLDVKNPRRN